MFKAQEIKKVIHRNLSGQTKIPIEVILRLKDLLHRPFEKLTIGLKIKGLYIVPRWSLLFDFSVFLLHGALDDVIAFLAKYGFHLVLVLMKGPLHQRIGAGKARLLPSIQHICAKYTDDRADTDHRCRRIGRRLCLHDLHGGQHTFALLFGVLAPLLGFRNRPCGQHSRGNHASNAEKSQDGWGSFSQPISKTHHSSPFTKI